MTLRTTALRAPWRTSRADHLRAAVVTALLPAVSAALLLWLVPAGCDVRGNPALYRWTCLFPGLMVAVPPMAALVLPIAFALNGRFARPLPDGWLVLVCAAGCLTQLALAGGYLVMLDPAYHRRFLAELFQIPQPFVAGAVAGAVYWSVLHWRKRGLPKG